MDKLLEVVSSLKIGDYIFLGIDIFLLLLIFFFVIKNIKRRKAIKNESLKSKKDDKEIVLEKIEIKEEEKNLDLNNNEEKDIPKINDLIVQRKEPVHHDRVEKLNVEKKENLLNCIYDNTVPFQKINVILPNKVEYQLGKGWESVLRRLKRNVEFREKLWPFIYNSYQDDKKITPEFKDLFKPLEYCDPSHMKVIFINKQPNLNLKEDGLAFSTNEKGKKTTMFNELYEEARRDRKVRAIRYSDGSLKKYAKQGVFLYNYILTNAVGESKKHETCGWELFSNMVIKEIAKEPTPKVFVLFGNYVNNAVGEILKNFNHKVIFISSLQKINGSNLFSEINEYLENNNIKPVNWSLGKIRK